MRLYSYIVARDFGFAPNPFFGVCTLATCKQQVRARAVVGDWVVGTGSKKKKLHGRLVYAMKVDEILTFDQYWGDARFASKRPLLNGSLKQRYGDNIYHHDGSGRKWIQENSHHTLHDGSPNPENVKNDTGTTQKVLISRTYGYWGRQAPKLPAQFRKSGNDICCVAQGHKCKFADEFILEFVKWLESLGLDGMSGTPGEFP